MGIQRYRVAPYLQKSEIGNGILYADHLTALARQREGIATIVYYYLVKEGPHKTPEQILHAIRAYAGEEEESEREVCNGCEHYPCECGMGS